MGTGHLILGTITDHITGNMLADTHDERIRQRIARILTGEKGFLKHEIHTRQSLAVEVDQISGAVIADFVIHINHRPEMIIIYGPGSVVTRQRPALAVARLLTDRIIPVAVITNGNDAAVMSAITGKTLAEGLPAIPSRGHLLTIVETAPDKTLSTKHREKEKRILFAMEILTRKECETYVCPDNMMR